MNGKVVKRGVVEAGENQVFDLKEYLHQVVFLKMINEVSGEGIGRKVFVE